MHNTGVTPFQAAIDAVEAIVPQDREALIELLRHRMIEDRRAEIADNVAQTRKEYEAGEVQRGTPDDLIAELAG